MNLLSSREESVFLAPSGKHLRRGIAVVILAFLMLMSSEALAHAVAQGDKGYIQEITGTNIVAFIYLGAKHMVTGYDHVLFLFGVIFFLYKMKDIALYVSLFALGHSSTMLLGVFFNCLLYTSDAADE